MTLTETHLKRKKKGAPDRLFPVRPELSLCAELSCQLRCCLPGEVVVECGEDERTVPQLAQLSQVREERYGHTTRIRFFEKTQSGEEKE